MKSLMPCLGLVATLVTPVFAAVASGDGISAYRQGDYSGAASSFAHDSVRDGMSAYYLGRMYLYGYGELKNKTLALHFFKQAADAGIMPAMQILARVALIQDHDPTQALYWFKKAADAGDVPAAMYCAASFRFGLGTKINEDMARRYTIFAAQKGNALAQFTLGEQFLNARNLTSQRLGVAWLNKALEKQYVPAAIKLSELYATGTVVAKDPEKSKNLADWVATRPATSNTEPTGTGAESLAARWLSLNQKNTLAECGYGLHGILMPWKNAHALEQNNYNPAPQLDKVSRDALFNPHFVMTQPNDVSLIDYYYAFVHASNESEHPLDLPRYALPNKTIDLHLIQKAVLGDSTIQFELGQLYQNGISVEKNIKQAIMYYQKAAEQQELRAEYNLGLLYLEGDGVNPDYQQALRWLNDAAFKGNPESQFVLGQIYEFGYHNPADTGSAGIAADPEKAKSMYYLAAANRQPRAQFRLADVLLRDSDAALTLNAKQKRDALMQRLYEGAVSQGVTEAELPLAFFHALDTNAETRHEAFNVAKAQAEKGDAKAAFLLALLYDRGIGVEASHTSALSWYKKASNNPAHDFIMGTYLAEGNGVTLDRDEAHRLLTNAANAGFSYAPLNLTVLEKQQGQPFLDNLLHAHQTGNARASLLLADYYLTFDSNPEQLKSARNIYQQLALNGNPEGQLKLAYLLEYGLGGVKNVPEAATWYAQAANQGHAIAQYRLGRLYQMGLLGGTPDYDAAKKWYQAALVNYTPAAVALGFIEDTVEDNYTQAQRFYQLAADKKDPVAQFDLGLMFELGKGVAVEVSQAQSLYLVAANQGHVKSMVQLAGLSLSGQMGVRDEASAIVWYKKAADKGDAEALYQLGVLSEAGIGMPLDYAAAMRFYEASAAKGNAKAKLATARCYQYGLGNPKNLSQAVELYKGLAANGNASAAYELAMLAYSGAMGEENRKQSKPWLEQAFVNGNQQAGQMLQWLNAQNDTRVSFIEPVVWTQQVSSNGESAHWAYLGVLNAWNQGNTGDFRVLLNRLVQEYPNYSPAKEAYAHMQENQAWEQS